MAIDRSRRRVANRGDAASAASMRLAFGPKGAVGGLHGEVSTVDMIKLRKKYNQYVIRQQTSGGPVVPFKQWAETQKGK